LAIACERDHGADVNPLLLPTSLVKRALDDLSEIADAARRLTSLESGVLGGLSRMEAQLDGLRDELAPIRELADVRRAVEPLHGQLDGLHEEIAALREEAKPIAEISRVREGIEPLDEDMHAVRHSVDDLEPLIREVNQRLEQLDSHIETLRDDLSPLGDLADKVPGVGRR
jgi:chromosome segregation ATPase